MCLTPDGGKTGLDDAGVCRARARNVPVALLPARLVRPRRRAPGGGLAPCRGGAENGEADDPAGQRAQVDDLDRPSGRRAGPGLTLPRRPAGESSQRVVPGFVLAAPEVQSRSMRAVLARPACQSAGACPSRFGPSKSVRCEPEALHSRHGRHKTGRRNDDDHTFRYNPLGR